MPICRADLAGCTRQVRTLDYMYSYMTMRAWQCGVTERSNVLACICVWARMHQRRIGCRVPEAFNWVHDAAPRAGSIAGTQITGSLIRAVAELGLCTLITDCTLQRGNLTQLTLSHMHLCQAMHSLQAHTSCSRQKQN